jgi:hypothetical protein
MAKLKAKASSLASQAKSATFNAMHKASEKLPDQYRDRMQAKLGPSNSGPRIEHEMQPTLASGNYSSSSIGGRSSSGGGGSGGSIGGKGGYHAPGAGDSISCCPQHSILRPLFTLCVLLTLPTAPPLAESHCEPGALR